MDNNSLIKFLKKGSGIHIKKENHGKFTDYCGGKVTSACIAKGKASSNPVIRKRATFAANVRKWKHLEGGIVKALLGWLADLGYKMGLGSKGDWRRMRSDLVDFGILLDNSDNPNQLIGSPTILPSRVSNKLVSSVAKVNDKGLPVTKKFNSGVKNDATFLTGDNRFVNSGRNKITNSLRERAKYMITNSYPNTLYYKDLLKLLKGQAKAESMGKDVKRYSKEINNVLDDFIWNSGYFKEGGVILSAQEGTKMNFGLKVGNFLNSELFSTLVNTGVGVYSNIKLNKAIDKAIEAKREEEKAVLQKNWLDNYKEALGQLTDRSAIVNLFRANNIANSLKASKDLNILNEINQLLNSKSSFDWLSSIGGLASSVLNDMSLFSKKDISNKNSAPSTTLLPKLTTSTWTPNTTLSTNLGLYSTPLTDTNKFWNL